MAANVTAASIILQARRRADMENSTFIGTPGEELDMLNEAYGSLYSLMVSAYENYFIKSPDGTITLTAGTDTYALPTDLYKLVSLDYLSGTRYQTLFPFDELERNATLSSSASIPSGTVRVRYVPTPTVFAATTDLVDCIAGWQTLLISDMAIMMLDKEESDTDRVERRRARDFSRIQEASHNRAITFPGRVSDVTMYDNAWVRTSLRWRLYGSNVQFISTEFLGF